MRHTMARLGAAAAISVAALGVTAAPSHADSSHTVTVASAVVADKDTGGDGVKEDNSGKWGLAGLLGALGLAGLIKGKQAYDDHRDRSASGATRASSNSSTTRH